MITTEKITVELIKELPEGQPLSFKLPTPMAVESGRTLAYKYGRLLGCSIECRTSSATPDVLTIIRRPLKTASRV